MRGSVDRPTIAFTRLLLPELSSAESAASYALRAWRRIEAEAPAAARDGHKVLFVTKAISTRVLALYFRAAGVRAAAFATNGMDDVERTASLATWRADPAVLLLFLLRFFVP